MKPFSLEILGHHLLHTYFIIVIHMTSNSDGVAYPISEQTIVSKKQPDI